MNRLVPDCAPQILVLAWADNRKDLEVVWKLLSQVLHHPRQDGAAGADLRPLPSADCRSPPLAAAPS